MEAGCLLAPKECGVMQSHSRGEMFFFLFVSEVGSGKSIESSSNPMLFIPSSVKQGAYSELTVFSFFFIIIRV